MTPLDTAADRMPVRHRWARRFSVLPAAGGAAAVVIAVLAAVAVAAPLITPRGPDEVSLLETYAGPSGAHLLGTDSAGRDLLSRLVIGSQTALLGPLLVVLLAGSVGSVIAVVSAWRGGWLDTAVARVLDIVFAFPGILLALVVAAVLSPGLPSAVVALSVAYVPYIARLVRGEALRQRNLPYVQALEVQGASGLSICVRHLLPNLRSMIIAQITLTFGSAMVDIAALSFLGLGVRPPRADWGQMVSSGQSGILRGFPQESVYSAALIVTTVVAFTVLGDRLAARQEEEGGGSR